MSLTGIASVAMAIVVSYGLCSAFGVFYGPVHSILPFLLLGIGIDDMFVIVQCWSNLNKEEMKRSLPVRIGITMKHAGVSITITSVTDFAAFAVGATTVIIKHAILVVALINRDIPTTGFTVPEIVLHLFCCRNFSDLHFPGILFCCMVDIGSKVIF